MLETLKNKKILILGFGREGRDTFRFLRRFFPDKILGVGDQKEFPISNFQFPKVRWHLGKNYLKAIKDYEVIIKSPGIPPKIIAPYIKRNQKITSQTKIFFENCPGKIIGVTGTKGKSTTAFLIYKILKEGNVKAHLVGNIGKPVLNLLFSATKNDVYVYELSSHQLMNLRRSPQIAIFLNIYPEHLDYYQNFKEYLKAKKNITRYQTKDDYFIYNDESPLVKKVAKITKAQKISLKNHSNILKNIGISKPPLLGKHNFLNMAAAIKVGEIFKISKEKIKKAIEDFKPLPHRLEYIGAFKRIKFYNDALSTIPQTTIAALDALGNDVETIILGGFDRGLDFRDLAKRILKSKIKNVVLFPTTGKKIWQSIVKNYRHRESVKLKHFFVDNMREAVKLAYQYTPKRKICLLSTASPSYGIFKDYKEKGNLFKKYVKKFSK